MTVPDRLIVDKNSIPCEMQIELAGEIFRIRFDYNALHDFFTATLSRRGKVVVHNEKIVYGKPLFASVWLGEWVLSCGRHYPARPDRQRGQGDLGDLR